MRVSVVIPAYNEEENIGSLIERIYRVLPERDTEIIVVDDGSSDNTGEVAQKYGAKVIRNTYNMGNGAAIKRGVRGASLPVVVLMDADGQHPPEEIPRLLEKLDKFDMVIGARMRVNQSWWRWFANKVYNFLASYVTGINIKDLTSGFRAVKRDKMLSFLYLLPNTFSYPTTLTLSFIKAAYPVEFVPVKTLPRKKGRSKINILADGARFFIIILRISVFFYPLKIFLPLSLMFFMAGLFYYLFTFTHFHRFTNMSALLFITSVIIFMLGLVSEQIASLRFQKIDD